MRTHEERRMLLHQRAEQLNRRRTKRAMAAFSSVSGILLVVLTSVIASWNGIGTGMIAGALTGSSLVSESAGGYVLAAVLAFVAGVIVTVLLIRRNRS